MKQSVEMNMYCIFHKKLPHCTLNPMYRYNIYAFDNNNIETYCVFDQFLPCFSLLCGSILSALCEHIRSAYGERRGKQHPPPDSTFAIQTYGCFSFIEYMFRGRNFMVDIVNKIPDNFTWNCKGP